MWRHVSSNLKWLARSAFAATVAVPLILAAPSRAEAGNGWSPGAALAVGVIGGIALGTVLADRHGYDDYDAHYYPRYYRYGYPRYSYYRDPACYPVRERVYVPGYGWEYRRRYICD